MENVYLLNQIPFQISSVGNVASPFLYNLSVKNTEATYSKFAANNDGQFFGNRGNKISDALPC
jgi:hypothetical protein